MPEENLEVKHWNSKYNVRPSKSLTYARVLRRMVVLCCGSAVTGTQAHCPVEDLAGMVRLQSTVVYTTAALWGLRVIPAKVDG